MPSSVSGIKNEVFQVRQSGLLQQKKVLITAGASQIGSACASLFAAQGAVVAIADKDREKGECLRDSLVSHAEGCVFYAVDLCSKAAVALLCDEYLADFGAPDVWLNCAGVCHPAYIDEQEEAPMEEMMTLNLLSAFRIMKRLAEPMKQNHGGSVIHLASDYAISGANGLSVYAATKGGLYAMANAFAMDYAAYGIRVNSILPGVSLASCGDRLEREIGSSEAERFWQRSQLLPRRGRVDEIADVALFLASDMSKLLNGEALQVNGGQNIIAHNQVFREHWGAST